jgi:hypothetical protein
MNSFPDLVQNMSCAEIEDPMNRVDPETVDMVFRYPVQGILNHESAHFIAPRAIEIDSRTPGGPVPVSKIRAIVAEIVPFGSQVVVDNVKKKGQPFPVACIDQVF